MPLPKHLIYLISGLILFGIIVFLQLILLGINDIFAEGLPELSNVQLLKSAAIAIAGGMIAWGLMTSETGRELRANLTIQKIWLPCLISSLGLCFALLHYLQPQLFWEFAKEDGPIENASAYIYFISTIVCLIAGWLHYQSKHAPAPTFAFCGLAALFFLIGMEEISWFQRVFDIETPEFLKQANDQEELNFHNFGTNKVENLYYLAAYCFIGILPLLRHDLLRLKWLQGFEPLFPSAQLFLLAAVFAAYNCDMWNIPFLQLPFFISVFLILILYLSSQEWILKGSLLYCLTLTLTTQGILMLNGDSLIRIWDVTEYKELFIPIAFLVYSLEKLTENHSQLKKT